MLRDILLGVSRQKRSLLLTITKTCANWWHFSSPPGGYEVLEAQSGRAAIHAAMEGNPNLILLDLRLPDMNGIEVARELQKIPETAHIPVIAWTADYRAKPHRDMLLQAGLFDCIQKPVSLRELEAVVARCLNPVSA